ncbi:MAG: extracellular solute-binding protein [Spirochaetaceae bacterium]|nr:extracellular solute-binding protein [Spirochaetaceae bacterium]
MTVRAARRVLTLVLLAACLPATAESYLDYLRRHRDWPEVRLDRPIVVPGTDFAAAAGSPRAGEIDGVAALQTQERGSVSWDVTVPRSGLYRIQVTCHPLPGRRMPAVREIAIDGRVPFEEARRLSFPRTWDDSGGVRIDVRGNQIRPRIEERPRWTTAYLRDRDGDHAEPFSFFLRRGVNTVTLTGIAEPMAVASLAVTQRERPPSYAEYRDAASAFPEASGFLLKIQGEDAGPRSSATLFPVHDKGDPSIEPYHPYQVRMNSIGGYRWAKAGDWIEWTFAVPASGRYRIAVKAKQDINRGARSWRRISIDGKVPFREAEAVAFPYSSSYRVMPLGGEAPYLFHLEGGEHTIRMEAVLGEFAGAVAEVDAIVADLLAFYRDVIMITSSNPDPFRSYQLIERIPEEIGELPALRERLLSAAGRVEGTAGSGGISASVQELAVLLDRMARRPEVIPFVLSELQNAITALSVWAARNREQPLQVDYLVVASTDREFPETRVSLFVRWFRKLQAFVASFSPNYLQAFPVAGERVAGSDEIAGGEVAEESGAPVTVWMGTGRDQSQILRQIIDDLFTPATGIPVELELVRSIQSILIPANLAGTAPDAVIGHANMELAFRGMLADLSAMDGYAAVAERFAPGALAPFSHRGGVYALPETMSFPVLFYRTDILDSLGIGIPATWDEVRALLPTLRAHHLDFGLGMDPGSLLMMVNQRGVPVMKEDSIETNLDSETVIATVDEFTDLFIRYDVPYAYNFFNRFRFGEMPLAIQPFSFYNTLVVFAPELAGRWGMAMVPGTRTADGTVNRTVTVLPSIIPEPVAGPGAVQNTWDVSSLTAVGITGSSIVRGSSNLHGAWEFLKWWSGREAQVLYGTELESLLGEAARYAPANLEALAEIPWSPAERRVLFEQADWVEGLPPIIGSYYVFRNLNWMIRAIVVDGDGVRESVRRYDDAINRELHRKRAEFGLETDRAALPQEYQDRYWERFVRIDRLEDADVPDVGDFVPAEIVRELAAAE